MNHHKSNVTSLQSSQQEPTSILIGNREIPSRAFLAPLAGYTHHAFRSALRELGGMGLATTDLVQATHLLSQTKKSLELIETSPFDRPLSVQIYGGHIAHLVKAAQWLQEHDYLGIDINMGCPMAKVNSRGGGARLMCDLDNAVDIAKRVVDAVSLPVTVKMRLGWDEKNQTAPALAEAFENSGVAAITIHGRTRAQGFHGVVNLKGIREVVQSVRKIPVIGNGDVCTVEAYLRMRKETGCQAVAIGRGAMLDPWIFRKVTQFLGGHPIPEEPSPDEQMTFLLRHFELMTQQHAEYSCILFRKFAAWYGVRLGIPEDLESRLRTFESFAEFNQIVKEIEKRHGERESQIPTALVKVPNGPVAYW